MSVWLILLLGLFALVCAVVILPFRIIVAFDIDRETTLAVRLRILGIPIPVFSLPQRQKLPNLRKFRIGALRRQGKKLARKEETQKKKQAAKQQKKAAKAAKAKKKQTQPPKPKTAAQKIEDLSHLLKLIKALAGILFRRFGRHLRVKVRHLKIRIATEDAAKTAILYGSVYAALETLWTMLENMRPWKENSRKDVILTADFCSEKPAARGQIEFRLCVWHLFAILIEGGAEALRYRSARKKRESAEEQAERAQREAAARAEVIRELKS